MFGTNNIVLPVLFGPTVPVCEPPQHRVQSGIDSESPGSRVQLQRKKTLVCPTTLCRTPKVDEQIILLV